MVYEWKGFILFYLNVNGLIFFLEVVFLSLTIDVNAGNSSCKIAASLCHYDENDDDDCVSISGLSMHVAAKSASSSVFSSPVTSPHGSNNNAQHFFDHHTINNFLQQFNDNDLNLDHHHHHHHLPQANNNKNNVHFCPASLSTAYSSNPKNNHVDAHPLPLPPRVSSSMKGQWQKGKLIGRSTFGSVYHATNLETGASCAMKKVDIIPDDPTSAECIKQLEQEIKILHQLHHPNIVQYYGSEIVSDFINFFFICSKLVYVHPGSVNKFIREHCGVMTESVVRNFTRNILSGLAYLHSTKTIHRDIKGANLLVNESGIVKLADFGMAKILSGNSYELSLKGSPYWMAPEVMKAAIKNESNPDVWSLGCTIIEMLSRKASLE
ncbi:hypothetical protein AHAS_Ahas06G0236400 [Arachis hypogaea]